MVLLEGGSGGWGGSGLPAHSDEYLRLMKKLTIIGLAALLSLCGCARHYVVKFYNGNQIVVKGKPQHKGNSYYIKMPNGEVQRVSEGSVALIEPASMSKKDNGPFKSETLR